MKKYARVISESYVDSVTKMNIDYNGETTGVILGRSVGGWFLAIPSEGLACNFGISPSDGWYNRRKLRKLFHDNDKGDAFADAINIFWMAKQRGMAYKEA